MLRYSLVAADEAQADQGPQGVIEQRPKYAPKSQRPSEDNQVMALFGVVCKTVGANNRRAPGPDGVVAEFGRSLIKAAPAAPLARRQRRAQRWGRPPGARRAIATEHAGPGGSRRQAARWYAHPSPSLPIVQLAGTASRSPCGRRCAIGFAEPRPGAHSHGSSRMRGERNRLDLSRSGWPPAQVTKPLPKARRPRFMRRVPLWLTGSGRVQDSV